MSSGKAVLLLVVVLLAGCGDVTDPVWPAGTTGETAAPATETPAPPDNPWRADPVVVGITDASSSDRDYAPLVREALDYWTNESVEHAGHEINYTLRENATRPDIEIRFVASVPDCGHRSVDDALGCAPLIDPWTRVEEPTVIRIRTGYTDETTVTTIKHELGHTLGLEHGEGPAFMNATGRAVRLPMTNATDRPHPWRDPDLTVHVDYANVPADERDGYERQVAHAIEYYARGAEGTVPPELSVRVVENRSDADVVVSFPDEPPCADDVDVGSCGGARGENLDADPALEHYTRYEITVSGIDRDAVGWHVGYWLGRALGATGDADLPPPFRDADYDDRRTDWWDRGEGDATGDRTDRSRR